MICSSRFRSRVSWLALVVASTLFAVSTVATAQTPDRSSDVYQDWMLNCAIQKGVQAAPAQTKPDPKAKPPANPKLCEVVQSFRSQSNNRVVAVVALGRPQAGADRKFIVQVPVGVWLPDGLSLTAAGKPPVTGSYLRCTTSVCLAQVDARPELVDALKKGTQTILEFSDAGRTRAKLTISPKGFADALPALEARD